MKKFWKYIFPALFGLAIYFTIRAVNDTTSHFKFWERDWRQNLAELILSALFGYFVSYMIERVERKTIQRQELDPSLKTAFRDFLKFYFQCFIMVNLVHVPFTALTDDGLSWGDWVQINVIPVLFLMLYFAIRRGNFYLKNYVENKIRTEQIHSEQLQTELDFLKSQIQPHFLFNSLNTIYFEMDESVEGAKQTVEQFSDLLRYQLYQANEAFILLKKEIENIENFIRLHQKRLSTKLDLKVDLPQDQSNWKMVPLLMLPLVENAFKYVGGAYLLEISGKIEEDSFCFKVKNAVDGSQINTSTDCGIGLQNLKRRLELLYPNQNLLKIESDKSFFCVELNIPLIQ